MPWGNKLASKPGEGLGLIPRVELASMPGGKESTLKSRMESASMPVGKETALKPRGESASMSGGKDSTTEVELLSMSAGKVLALMRAGQETVSIPGEKNRQHEQGERTK